MSFDVPPLARPLAAPSVDRSSSAAGRSEGTSFSDRTIEGVTPPIPAEVWDQIDAAARLAESLHAEGRGVRFDVHKLDGDVVAALVDEDGAMLRPLLLEDVVDVDKLAHELGKEPSP
jgi:hypothetical protein